MNKKEILFQLWSTNEFKVILVIAIVLLIDKILDILLRKIFNSRFTEIIVTDKNKNHFLTVFNLIRGLKSIILLFIGLIVILSIYKIKITSLLTGFGIIGIIIGLASQAILSDLFGGITIIWDKLYFIGDRVKIGDIEGEVINITLRRTSIKDENGYIHSIPNSQIKLVSKKIEKI